MLHYLGAVTKHTAIPWQRTGLSVSIIKVLRDTQDELREIADELAHHGRETSERQVYESIGRIEAVKTIIESEHNDGSARRVLAGIVETIQSGRFDGRPSHAEYIAAMEVLGR